MRTIKKQIVSICAMLIATGSASATDLTIHLSGSQPITRSTMQYQCDAQGVKMGLPDGTFSVEYLNGAGNSLAVVPIHGSSLIFTTVMSGSGARYAAQEFIWWEAGDRGVSLSSDSLGGQMRSECHRVKAQ
jgi:membrane-bound inhibitor of C-type lysozyme